MKAWPLSHYFSLRGSGINNELWSVKYHPRSSKRRSVSKLSESFCLLLFCLFFGCFFRLWQGEWNNAGKCQAQLNIRTTTVFSQWCLKKMEREHLSQWAIWWNVQQSHDQSEGMEFISRFIWGACITFMWMPRLFLQWPTTGSRGAKHNLFIHCPTDYIYNQ